MPLDIVLFAILYSEGPSSLYTASPPWAKIRKKVQFIEASKAKINVFIYIFSNSAAPKVRSREKISKNVDFGLLLFIAIFFPFLAHYGSPFMSSMYFLFLVKIDLLKPPPVSFSINIMTQHFFYFLLLILYNAFLRFHY